MCAIFSSLLNTTSFDVHFDRDVAELDECESSIMMTDPNQYEGNQYKINEMNDGMNRSPLMNDTSSTISLRDDVLKVN